MAGSQRPSDWPVAAVSRLCELARMCASTGADEREEVKDRELKRATNVSELPSTKR